MTKEELKFNYKCITKSLGDFDEIELERLTNTFVNYAIKFKEDGNLL